MIQITTQGLVKRNIKHQQHVSIFHTAQAKSRVIIFDNKTFIVNA